MKFLTSKVWLSNILLSLLAPATYSADSSPSSLRFYFPLLEIGKELLKRNHQIFYAANDDQISWAAHVLSDNVESAEVPGDPTALFYLDYTIEYPLLRRIISGEWSDGKPMDVVLCDLMAIACMDAAYSLGVPYIISSMGIGYQGYGHQPYLPVVPGSFGVTLEHASFWQRFSNSIILPAIIKWKQYKNLSLQHQKQVQFGVESYSGLTKRYDDGLVIISTFPGLEPPIPLAAHISYIGPTLPKEYPPMTDEVELFLKNRSRVVFVAFGSIIVVPPERYEMLVTALVAAYRANLLDGVIWGMMNTNAKDMPNVIYRENTGTGVHTEEHRIKDMLSGEHPFICIINRASQRALLKHPSVKLFVSHCGLLSVHEAIDAKTPILGIPGFGDQPQLALHVEHLGIGRRVLWPSVNTPEMQKKLHDLLGNEHASGLQENLEKVACMATIYGRRLPFAADLVELAAIPGAIKLLQSADRRMPWWKAQNIDVWAILTLLLLLLSAGTIYSAIRLTCHFKLMTHRVEVINKIKAA
ncbi:hypothetical protein BDF19DRAFT_433640 [Syncephalis fuscata]|nr:hypothetical protein BDF19DRAFT_433640 [Syncephalis fuscata]